MPSDRPREKGGFLSELLGIVLAEVEVGWLLLVEGKDVWGGFEFGYRYEPDPAFIAHALDTLIDTAQVLCKHFGSLGIDAHAFARFTVRLCRAGHGSIACVRG